MQESTDRPAWTSTLFQGMGSGLDAYKHRIVRKNRDEVNIIHDYPWTADADAVKAN